MLGATPLSASECPDIGAIAMDDTPRRFVQARSLPSLPKPLKSSGFLTAREDRFTWRVCAPFDIRTVIDANGVTQSIEGGAPTPLGSAAMQSAIQKISIAEVFRGRLDRLEAVFDIDHAKGDAGWRAILTPRSSAVAGVVSSIELSGCTAIDRVAVSYRDGGLDDIAVGAPVEGMTSAECGVR